MMVEQPTLKNVDGKEVNAILKTSFFGKSILIVQMVSNRTILKMVGVMVENSILKHADGMEVIVSNSI